MPLLILSPVLALALVQGFWPEAAFHQAVPFPATAFAVMGLLAVVAALMRQTDYLYWLALLAGHYWAAQVGLQRPLAEPEVAALYQVLPLFMSIVMLLLTVVPLPSIPSVPGLILLTACAFLPAVMPYLPLTDWLVALALPDMLYQRPLNGIFLSWMHIWWLASLSFLWLALVTSRASHPSAWGQTNAWLALILFYALLNRDNASGWMTVAATTGLLIALAYRMVHLAYIDELTGLPQRRALENRLRGMGRKSAVTMLDVDHFKSFNDTWGHEVGDQVLRLLGAILSKQSGLQAFRYGGEEFTLVFSHDRKKDIKQKLEAVRAEVEAYPLRLRQDEDRPDDKKSGKQRRGSGGTEKTVNITISLGCALRQPGEAPDAILKRADEALYKAKQGGRNKVVM